MKQFKRAAALILTLCMVFALTACSSKPKAEDAEKYVKAVLDIICTGDYDHSVNLVDADEMSSTLDEAIDSAVESLSAEVTMTDEVKANFREVMMDLFAKSKYTVGEATEVEGGFDVPVTLEPIQVGSTVEDAVNAAVDELVNDPETANMTQDDIMNALMQVVIDALKAELDDPQYGDSVEVTVRYKELEDGVYGVDEADGEKLGEAMFQAF